MRQTLLLSSLCQCFLCSIFIFSVLALVLIHIFSSVVILNVNCYSMITLF